MTKQSRKKIISLILGIIFAFGILIGHAFNLEGSFRCYFNSTNTMIKTVIVLGGMSSLFAVLLYKVYSFDFWENGVRERNKTSKVNIFIFDKHPWGIPFVILIVCWLPYIVYLFPGTISWDGLVFFVKHFSLKKASEFPVFSEGFSLL